MNDRYIVARVDGKWLILEFRPEWDDHITFSTAVSRSDAHRIARAMNQYQEPTA